MKTIIPFDDVVTKIRLLHGDQVSLDEATYNGVRAKARFIDAKHGEWWGKPQSVLRGAEHPAKHYQKIMASCLNNIAVKHWKTGVICWAQASYELAVLRWFNANNVDFDWQVPFETPIKTPGGKNSVYYVDAYVKSGEFVDTYIEIKGTWNRKNGHVGRAKWEWFHTEHPNSVLWMKGDLKRLGVLV